MKNIIKSKCFIIEMFDLFFAIGTDSMTSFPTRKVIIPFLSTMLFKSHNKFTQTVASKLLPCPKEPERSKHQ